jgi:hypothetical protein
LQSEVREDQRERWESIVSRVEAIDSEVEESMARLQIATENEANAVQEEAAERLADLEGAVVEAELEVIAERDALIVEAGRRLNRLEADLDEVARIIWETGIPLPTTPEAGPQIPTPGAGTLSTPSASGRVPVDPARVDELRAELSEVRARIAAIHAEAEEPTELAEVREEVSTRVAEATRDVREALYVPRWAVAVRM